ncbi:MAG: hypothetical protein QNJ54_01465 [Prochloraceae cyanobacterium]|nr:hypothetical protein [Prochloraceae cyanobacterium]
MSETAFQIKNPSVTLYAFHLCQDLTQEPEQLRPDAERLWQNCAALSELLAIPELKSFPEKLQSQPTKIPITSRYIKLLPDNGRLKYTPLLQIEGYPLTIEVYPLQIHDTYALDLTLYYQNLTVSASQFSHLNPQGCLLASKIQASLGQTLVLYAEPVGSPQEDRKLADACVDAFLSKTDQQQPFFSASGQLFGSPIFEYDNGQEKPREQCHILVWLNRHPETLKLATLTYFSFLNLLCCRSKILFAYHEARWCYRQTREFYAELEDEVELFKKLLNQPEERLEQLKQKLTQIPPKSFKYAGYLRDIEDHKTAIATNTKNYEYWLQKIRSSSLEIDDLEFLENFLTQSCQRFQAQIQVNLNYLTPGQQLFEQMLVTIRGLVEIEQAHSDRKRLENEKEIEKKQADRDRRLERTVQVVGTGLAVGAIAASSSPNSLRESPLLPPFATSTLHPFFFSFLVSFSAAIIAGLIAGLVGGLLSQNK